MFKMLIFLFCGLYATRLYLYVNAYNTVHECMLLCMHMCMLVHVHMCLCGKARDWPWVYCSIALSTVFFFWQRLPPWAQSSELTSWPECWPQSSGPALGLQMSIVPHHAQLISCWRSELSPSCLCGRHFLPDPSRSPPFSVFSLL